MAQAAYDVSPQITTFLEQAGSKGRADRTDAWVLSRELLADDAFDPIRRELVGLASFLASTSLRLCALLRDPATPYAGHSLAVPLGLWPTRQPDQALLTALEMSRIPVEPVAPDAFVRAASERASEFVEMNQGGSGAGDTIVNTRHDGETVLFCKGYFVSTVEGFGRSSPAIRAIIPGRYIFGVKRPEGYRFDDTLWTCPTTLDLDIP